MNLLGLERSVYVILMTVITFGNVPAHIWPFVNLCPQRGTFPMTPGCRLFCLCTRPGGAGRLLACPEGTRFNPMQERCTDDPEECAKNKQCDPPALLEKAECLHQKDMKTECDSASTSYCANRWELIICHPIWTHMLGVVECDKHGNGSHVCNLMTDACERNRSSIWETLAGVDSAVFGTAPGEDCDAQDDVYAEDSMFFSTMCCPPTLCRPTGTGATNIPQQTAKPQQTGSAGQVGGTTAVGPTTEKEEPEDDDDDDVGDDDDDDDCTVPDWPGADCKAMGSWCLPDSETIVTCGESKQVRQVKNCKTEFAKYNLEGACLPLVFGCAYWQLNPVSDSWVPGKSEHAADHPHEAFEGWFREHWCKTHGRRGVLCTPDGQSLAHCNEDLIVDSVFHCASFVPEGMLLGCQFCEPGTAFCIYRPRADIADQCGKPGPNDDHDVACGFFPRKGRNVLEIGNSSVPYTTNGKTTANNESAADKNETSTERTGQ